eukprot:scaffold2161_cov212-Alexandrium_tamarense.AAC.33
MDSGLKTSRGGDHGDSRPRDDNDGELQIRTMEIPEWLSNLDVTKHLVGGGKKADLEKEYECTILVTGEGSGGKDPSAPGYDLPHLLVTMSGYDIRQLGRVRRALEDSLIEYIIENTPDNEESDRRRPPPSLGRMLYSLALSSANASPKTKDHSKHRTVLARAHYGHQAPRRDRSDQYEHYAPPSRKVWSNVVELPTDESGDYHGRFLAGKNGSLLEYYRTKFNCQVNIYGVWGEDGENDPQLMCEPYVLVTSEEAKQNVDSCLKFIEVR